VSQKLSQLIHGLLLILDFDTEAGGEQWDGFFGCRSHGSQAHAVLFGGDERGCAEIAGGGQKTVEIGSGEVVVVGECSSSGKAKAGGFEAGEELLGAGDPAEGES
jgi:hypothetical protein